MDKKITIAVVGIIILVLIFIGINSASQKEEYSNNGATSTDSTQVVGTSTPSTNESVGSSVSSGTVNNTANNTVKSYTLAEVSKHASPSDCWTTVRGSVYNLTPFVSQHPRGERNILRLCGIDGTSSFEMKHGGSYRPEQELASLKIGVLAQ